MYLSTGTGHTSALFARKSQSVLDNVIAGFRPARSSGDPDMIFGRDSIVPDIEVLQDLPDDIRQILIPAPKGRPRCVAISRRREQGADRIHNPMSRRTRKTTRR